MMETDLQKQRIILFDGVCNLCNASVVFILQKERRPEFLLASIQSEVGKKLLESCTLPSDYLQSVIVIDHGKAYFGSTAALKIGQTLQRAWSLLTYAGFIVPKFIRDWVYKQIAAHRYQWFGKRDVCMVPTENLKARFLSP